MPGRAGADACASFKRKNSSRPTPNKPRPPAHSMSRRLRPSHSVFGEPKIRSMKRPPALRKSQQRYYPLRRAQSKEINPIPVEKRLPRNKTRYRFRVCQAPPAHTRGIVMETPSPPALSAIERRILGVLVEKAKTTP